MLFHFAASVIMDSPNPGDWHRDHTGGPVVAEEWIAEKNSHGAMADRTYSVAPTCPGQH